jgi:EAL domain-containing protein (putative c-di-GMP-specific phosphodiesterase class I)
VIGASIGIALAQTGAAATTEELERNADLAMYAAKNAGRGLIRFFEPEMHENALRRLDLIGDLRAGLARKEFVLHYQPIVSLSEGGRLVGVEALVRWNHPEHGLLGPGEFIGLAEEGGVIIPLGRFVLREACTQLGRWRSELAEADDLAVSVNVSAMQLHSPNLVEDIAAALADAGLDPHWLILEITESVLMRGDGVDELLARLHGLGVKLAIDDFGTGYSSLGYLHRYPFDILKIDRSFIDGLGTTAANDQLVAGIVSLAHCLDLVTIAEGVERAEQAEALHAMSGGLSQGYFFGRPQRAEEIAARLAADGRALSKASIGAGRLQAARLVEPL